MLLQLDGHGGGAGDHGLRDARGSQRGLGFRNIRENPNKKGIFRSGGWWLKMDTLPKFNSKTPLKNGGKGRRLPNFPFGIRYIFRGFGC